jgi:hypothetical protein
MGTVVILPLDCSFDMQGERQNRQVFIETT